MFNIEGPNEPHNRDMNYENQKGTVIEDIIARSDSGLVHAWRMRFYYTNSCFQVQLLGKYNHLLVLELRQQIEEELIPFQRGSTLEEKRLAQTKSLHITWRRFTTAQWKLSMKQEK